jgi:hypothetical protein
MDRSAVHAVFGALASVVLGYYFVITGSLANSLHWYNWFWGFPLLAGMAIGAAVQTTTVWIKAVLYFLVVLCSLYLPQWWRAEILPNIAKDAIAPSVSSLTLVVFTMIFWVLCLVVCDVVERRVGV